MQVDLNGSLVPAHEARISAFDAGFLYGDGLFDTMRSYRGFLFALDEHIARLCREAELLQIPMDSSVESWARRIGAVLGANSLQDRDARVRIQLSRGGGPDTDQVSAEPQHIDPTTVISAQPVGIEISEWQHKGIQLMTVQSSFARGNFPQIKSLNYLPSIMALRFARARGFEEACLLNRQNKVLEGSTSNVFLLHGNTLRTPSPRLGLLPGITRSKVMQLARSAGLKVEEAASDLRDLLLADEVFVTGSVKEIVPVIGVDSAELSDAQPGPWTRRLQEMYRVNVEQARVAASA